MCGFKVRVESGFKARDKVGREGGYYHVLVDLGRKNRDNLLADVEEVEIAQSVGE